MASESLRIEADNFTSDSLEAYSYGGRITVEIDEPWAGSTETGFGQTCSIGLLPHQAIELGEWLLNAGRAALSDTRSE